MFFCLLGISRLYVKTSSYKPFLFNNIHEIDINGPGGIAKNMQLIIKNIQ